MIGDARYIPLKDEYIFAWGNNPIRASKKGKLCRILATGNANSILIQFEDGSRMVTSRRAVRKAQ